MRWKIVVTVSAFVLVFGACSGGPFTIEWYPRSGCSGDGTLEITPDGRMIGEVQYHFSTAGGPSMWCEGLVHRLQDGVEISDYVFHSEGDDLLEFEVTDEGYVYLAGTGSVTDPDGRVTSLP